MTVYLKNTPKFKIKAYKNKQWKQWSAENNKMLTSLTWVQGYKPAYSFILDNDDVLEISRDQLGQCLLAAFDAGKTLLGLTLKPNPTERKGLKKDGISIWPKMLPQVATGLLGQKPLRPHPKRL